MPIYPFDRAGLPGILKVNDVNMYVEKLEKLVVSKYLERFAASDDDPCQAKDDDSAPPERSGKHWRRAALMFCRSF